MNMVLGQRAVYALGTANRGRLNALYMISIFIGGAFASSVASSLYEHFSWRLRAVGSALSLVTLIVFLVVSRRDAQNH
jgi:MFS family permease